MHVYIHTYIQLPRLDSDGFLDSVQGPAPTDGGLARCKKTGVNVIATNSLDNRLYRYACHRGGGSLRSVLPIIYACVSIVSTLVETRTHTQMAIITTCNVNRFRVSPVLLFCFPSLCFLQVLY